VREILAALLLAGPAAAAPVVVGYERFHAAAPTPDGGALLFSELGCANCHAPDPGLPRRQGPVLAGLRSRTNAEWVRAFLAAPHETKPGTNMPGFFPPGSGPDEIDAVTHHLLSLAPPPSAPSKGGARHANAERGSARYHQLGCVACHAPTPDFHPAAGTPRPEDFSFPSVPFPDLARKYSLASLTAFLEHPDRVRPDGRMPHLGLSAEDALDIASHLVDFRASDPRQAPPLPSFRPDPEKARLGAELVSRMRCAACHDLAPPAEPLPPVPAADPAQGCLAPNPAPGLPRYPLREDQRAALATYLRFPLSPDSPASDRARLTLQALNCLACHDRDGLGGPDAARNRYFTGDEAIADAGRLPPPLTGIGRKLRPAWMESVFLGRAAPSRPYLQTRMPRYPALARSLPDLLGAADRKPLPSLAPNPDHAAGRTLAGTVGGLNCVTCHVWKDKPSLGIQALDLSQLPARLNPEWFRDYLLDPAAYRPGTLMPPLWPGGNSILPGILGGDTERQIASLWAYLASGQEPPEGYPDHVSGAFELIPTDRPILQRAFLHDVGPYAILAGFPEGLHLAYDGDLGRPALVWRGRFFDAYSTWFVRAAPFERPLEPRVHAWPPPASGPSSGFRGYRLDARGNPTFLVTRDGVPGEDAYEIRDGALLRRVSWPASTPEPAWDHPEGVEVSFPQTPGPQQRLFLYRLP